MPASKTAADVLAEGLVRALEGRRALGGPAYPLRLRELAALADPTAPPDLALRAAGKRQPFGQRIVSVRAGDLDSPVALAEDAELLGGSGLTLDYLLHSLCTPTEPTCDLARLRKPLPAKLKGAFEAAFRRRLAANDLPAGAAAVRVEKKTLVYLECHPPLPPPEVALATAMLNALQAHRQADAYPPTLARLAEQAQPGATAGLIQAAVAVPAFRDRTRFGLKKSGKAERLESPVALADDVAPLANSPRLLEALVTLARTDATQVVSETDLKRHLTPALAEAFAAALARRFRTRDLPPTVGCLSQRDKPLLFLLRDVRAEPAAEAPAAAAKAPAAAPPTPPASPAAPPPAAPPVAPSAVASDFRGAFEAAFSRLDQERGHNFVSLVDLRRAVAVDRPTFDDGLKSLRLAGRYSLSAAEGRDGISPEENQAGIREDGSLLLFVSRRLS